MKPLTLYRAATPLLAKIYQLPFNIQLAEGSLTRKSFKFYIEQDLLYLATYSHLVKKTADHFKEQATVTLNSKYARFSETLLKFNQETIVYEETLRQKFLSNRAFTLIQPEPAQKIPILETQTQEIRSIVDDIDKPLFLAKAMVLITACPWVYLQIGKHLERNPIQPIAHVQDYKDWIQSYKPDSAFEDSVDELKRMLADILTPIADGSHEEQEILALFLKAIQFEHDFFSAAVKPIHAMHLMSEEDEAENLIDATCCNVP